MAFVATYNSLYQNILNYANRNDLRFQDAIPTFFTLALNRMSRDLKTLGLDFFATYNFTIATPVVTKPADWRATLFMNYGSGTNNNTRNILLPRSIEYMRLYWPDDSVTAPPVYYGDYNYQNWLICPTPDQSYPAEVGYFATLAPLDENNQTNWATNYAPDALLKAIQIEYSIFLQNYSDVATYTDAYNTALQSLISENVVRKTDGNYERSIG